MQISRLFEIVYIILEKGTVTARELAERFEVTARTIYRDVESLSAAGIPVYMTKGRNGGVSLMPDFILDKTVLSQNEKDEILSALSGIAATGNMQTGGALHKLASLFGASGYNWIETDFSGWGWTESLKDNFNILKEAILSRHVLTFDYYGGTGEKTNRAVEPLKLVFRGQSWYLYGYCRKRGSDRYFKLSRMEKLNVLNDVFSRKAPERVIRNESLEPETISIRFRAYPPISFRIYDEYPHRCIQPDDDGTLLVETTVPRGEWLYGYLLSFGEHIEILEPAEVRDVIRQTLDKMRALY